MKAAHGASETQMDAEAAEKQGGSDEQNGSGESCSKAKEECASRHPGTQGAVVVIAL